jgi:hypothetical protein
MSQGSVLLDLMLRSIAGPPENAGAQQRRGVPAELVDRFKPGGPGWAVSAGEMQPFLDAVRSGQPLHEALSPEFGAWMRLHGVLHHARSLREISASPEVSEFVDTLMLLVMNGAVGGTDRVFKEIRSAGSSRAGTAHRKGGEATRQDVADAWRQCEREGVKVRGRVDRIWQDTGIPKSTIRDALRKLGLHDPKSGKCG